MLLKEYLEAANIERFKDLSLVVATAVRDNNSPYHHLQYFTTPIFTVEEWLEGKEYIVLNPKQPPICTLTAPHFANMYNNGRLLSMLVITEEDIYKLYSPSQALEMLAEYDKAVNASINN